MQDRDPCFGDTSCDEDFLLIARSDLLGTHLGEEEYFLNAFLTRQEHHEAVHTDTHATRRGHTILEGTKEVGIDEHRFIVPLL